MAKLSPRLSDQQLKELQELLKQSKSGRKVKMIQAILLVNKRESSDNIRLITNLGRSRAFTLRQQYLKHGKVILEVKERGIKELLTRKQLNEIVQTVKNKKPKEIGFHESYEYWTTGVLARYIEEKYQVRYKSKTSYYLMFKRARFSYHKPGRIYQKYNQEKVQQWKDQYQGKIKQAWNDTNIVILCEDEMRLSTQTTFQKIWLPKNDYPQVKVSNTRQARSIYGFLNIKTGREHAFKTYWQNMYITKEQLMKIRNLYPNQKILLLWDGPGSHKGKEVTEFVKQDGGIEIIYFPPYAPDENPQEHVWKEGRKEVSHNHFIENIDKATDNFINFLNTKKFHYKLLDFKSSFGM